MRRYFCFQQVSALLVAAFLLAALLPGCGGCKKEANGTGKNDSSGADAQANGDKPAERTDFELLASTSIALDAVERKIREIEALEDDGQFGQASAKVRELLNELGDDSRRSKVEALRDRIKQEEDAAVDLEVAVENLSADSSQARSVARGKLANAGSAGLILVRRAFRRSSGMRVRLEAARIFSQSADPKAAPLIVDALQTLPTDPLWSELLKALSVIIQRHSATELDVVTLARLLELAERMTNPLYARMLRAIAANWTFGQFNKTQLPTLFGRLQKDTDYRKRHLASLFCIMYAKAANRDEQVFAGLVGGRERLVWLQQYVRAATKSEDEMTKSWGQQMVPLLALVDLQALKRGLLLYFDFNEPIYHPRYPREKRPMVYCRDQSGDEVTPRTPRVILKGVLRENCRVPGIEGNGIRFKPTGFIELPADWKFRQVMKKSYSYAAWIKPLSTPDGTSTAPFGIIIGKKNANVGLKFHTGNQVRFTHSVSYGSSVTAIGRTTLQLNQWHHVAGVVDVDAGSVKVYVNGKLDGQDHFSAGTEGDSNFDGVFGTIGGASADEMNPRTFDGVIDEVRIYGRAISDEEVYDLYRAFRPR